MALLAWIDSEKLFLKIQEGTGDNLLCEDLAAGYVDYVLWSTFRPERIDQDETLDMQLVDSGMIMTKEPTTARTCLNACLRDSCDGNPIAVVLMEDPLPSHSDNSEHHGAA